MPTGVKKSEPKNTRWNPRQWSDADRRLAIVRRFESLRAEIAPAPSDEPARRLLVDRAAYLSARLESMEVDSLTGPADMAEYRRTLDTFLTVLTHLRPGSSSPDRSE